MSSRKDDKGRVLLRGEYQRADGRYQFSYTDITGKRHYIYSKSIVELRKKEKAYQMADWAGAYNFGETATLNMVFDRYMSTKFGLKESTYASYMQMYDNHIREDIGRYQVKNLRYSDIIGFYTYLLRTKKVSIRTVEYVNKQIFPALELAVQDGLITKNPAKGAYGNFKRASGEKARRRHALTMDEQKVFINYLDGHPVYGRYHSIFQFMLGTGLRVGELCGLRWEDVDVEKRLIDINHSVVSIHAIKGETKAHLAVTSPKTEAGVRKVPMMQQVLDAIKEEYEYARLKDFVSCTLDGYTDFIFTNNCGNVYTSSRLDNILKNVVNAYNKEEEALAEYENREPLLLPHITNHILRHTFCTRLCERDVNIKVIQTVMGHASIKITMVIYAEVSAEKQMEEIDRLAQEIDVF